MTTDYAFARPPAPGCVQVWNSFQGWICADNHPPPATALPKPPQAIKPPPRPPQQNLPSSHPLPPATMPDARPKLDAAPPPPPATTGQSVLHLPAPSNNHAMSSSAAIYAYLLAGLLGIVVVRRVISYAPELVYNARLAASERAARRDEARRKAEWATVSRMSDQAIEAHARRLDQRVANLNHRADACEHEADRLEASALHGIPLVVPWIVAHWRAQGQRLAVQAEAASEELTAFSELSKEVAAAREVHRKDKRRADTRYLVRLVDSSDDTAARSALDRLCLRGQIEWPDLTEKIQLDTAVREHVNKCLRVMSATTSIHEARAALKRLKTVLRQNGIEFEDIFK